MVSEPKMSREILFRGKDADSGEWVYGWYTEYPYGRYPLKPTIIPKEEANGGYYTHTRVIPETVGQFTGYLDGTGQKIYEGDIVEFNGFRNGNEFGRGIGVVRWYQGVCNFELGEISGDTFTGFAVKWLRNKFRPDIAHWHLNECVRVIGNIHDNPELVEANHA